MCTMYSRVGLDRLQRVIIGLTLGPTEKGLRDRGKNSQTREPYFH